MECFIDILVSLLSVVPPNMPKHVTRKQGSYGFSPVFSIQIELILLWKAALKSIIWHKFKKNLFASSWTSVCCSILTHFNGEYPLWSAIKSHKSNLAAVHLSTIVALSLLVWFTHGTQFLVMAEVCLQGYLIYIYFCVYRVGGRLVSFWWSY